MEGHRPEVADVFREYGPQFLERQGGSLSGEQRHVLADIGRCRTAALGGHKWRCDRCGHEKISYNSCRNRHCPKCQASERGEWLEREARYLLEVEYFHVVFTLPAGLGPIALQNRRQLYGALFEAAAETLTAIARDPKHLGAEIGFLMVLHTWGQNLLHHPHLHCVVPGGGLSPDGKRWIPCPKGFFLPVRVLGRLFRGKFLALLEGLYARGELALSGNLSPLREPTAWQVLTATLSSVEWVVYSKPPFGGARAVLKYLARYTHRVAISSERLLAIDHGRVRFHWRDYAHGGKRRVMDLKAEEFIRRFLLHVLPKGFVRIRHYGFLSNRARARKLALVRELLEQSALETHPDRTVPNTDPDFDGIGDDVVTCPRCKLGRLVLLERFSPGEAAVFLAAVPDTS